VLTLSWILLSENLGVYEYSEFFKKRLLISSNTINENIYHDFERMANVLDQSE
jgi:hypothetical protein